MKEYRSAIRSRNMIKKAFFDLLSHKSITEITVVDVVNAADISRNTFYAHYNDVYAVLDEMENDFIEKLNIYIGDNAEKIENYSPLPLFLKVARFIEADAESGGLFLINPNPVAFYEKIKEVLYNHIMNSINCEEIKDECGFNTFLECLTSGFMNLCKKCLTGEISASTEDLSNEIAAIYTCGVSLYL